MNTDVWQIETAFAARWAGQVPGLEIKSTFDSIDWTAEDPLRVCAQVFFEGIEQVVGLRDAAIVPLRYSAHVFLDAQRQEAADRLIASAALSGALAAATGWEVQPGRFSQPAGGQRSAFDGRILRVSISFLIPTLALSLA